jgi:hypothetical protein
MDKSPRSPPAGADRPYRPGGVEGTGRQRLASACSVSLARSAVSPLLPCMRTSLAETPSSRAVADYLAHVGLCVPVEAIASLSRRSARSVSRDIGRVEGLRDTPSVDTALALLENGLVRLRRSLNGAA